VQRPRDLYIHRQLTQLYRFEQDTPGQIRSLKAELAIRYSEPVCQRLIGLLHLTSDYTGEQAALISCRSRGYRRPEGLLRLASLYAAEGNLAETAGILAAVDDRRWLSGSHERLMLFDALLSTDQPTAALRRAVRWYKGQPDVDLALEMISRLVTAGQNDLAMQMAREIGKPGDAVSLAAGEILVDQVQYNAARAYLAGWLAQSLPMTTETAIRFISAAVDADDPGLALRGGQKFGLDHIPPADLASLAEALVARGWSADFDTIRPYLTEEALQKDGLLAAAVDIRDGQLDAAKLAIAATVVDPADEHRASLKAQLGLLASRPLPPTRLLRDPAAGDNGASGMAGAPGPEPQVHKTTRAVEIARRVKRFGRRRIRALQATAPSVPKLNTEGHPPTSGDHAAR
jgi:hypothetical protein